jgi:hypothetical protein
MQQLPSTQPGFWKIFEGPVNSGWYFQCNCPCGCQYPDIVCLEKVGENRRTNREVFWTWDGNLQAPTITPSLKRHVPCGIHFNLTAGVYIAHADGAPLAPDCWKA